MVLKTQKSKLYTTDKFPQFWNLKIMTQYVHKLNYHYQYPNKSKC